MAPPRIQPYKQIIPMIYAYTTPGVAYHDGWIKIGYTDRQSVQERINQQTRTSGIIARLVWADNAIYKDGSGKAFRDVDFHNWLKFQQQVEYDDRSWPGDEWFKLDGAESLRCFNLFVRRELPPDEERAAYVLRREQEDAVAKTLAYFQANEEEKRNDPDWEGDEFLWNAKPRLARRW